MPKLRRVGNATVVTIPREQTEGGFEAGQLVTILPLGTGSLLLLTHAGRERLYQEILRKQARDEAARRWSLGDTTWMPE